MKIFKAAAAAVLALALLIQMPARAYAQTQNADTKDYISEVKIAMGGDAEKALEGYTILSDENGKAVDLNKDAGGGWGSQGDKRVILGYKTTKEQSEAITDLAVMNMKGGYDVQEYEALIKQRMDSQVIPLIQKLQAAKDFEDDARTLLQNWDAFREVLISADEKAAGLEEIWSSWATAPDPITGTRSTGRVPRTKERLS